MNDGNRAAEAANDETLQDEKERNTRDLDVGGEETPRQMLPSTLLHDLRTPLNQIIGYSEMLVEQAQDEGLSGFVPDLHKIRNAGRELLAHINNNFQSNISAAVPSSSDALNAQRIGETVSASEEQLASRVAKGLLLVVDDNEVNRDVLSQRLKRQGHDVVTAENGRDALIAVRSQAFDLVLLDIMMPEMDGYEVLQELKADKALRHIPVIMISALHELDSVVRCIEMGADDYLSKPFDSILLKARIGACLEKKRARDREMRLFEELEQSYKRLQELEKLRDDLTHMIVHDLRTPLTSIIAGILTLDAVGELNKDQREMVDISISGGQTLLGMINDMLDVDKLESGLMQLDYGMLSAAELVSFAVGQVASLAESKELSLIQQVDAGLPRLRGDEDKLRRTLVNLLGNAIKFTPKGGTVTVKARCIEDGQSMLFSVSDTGAGIPSEAFVRIFEKFGQVASPKPGGSRSTGLGLTFCKLAVEAHGGRIWVESSPCKGSTFSFTIPLQSSSSF